VAARFDIRALAFGRPGLALTVHPA